eukprot:55400-Chlamydomonas_euryale.AAC.3
MPSWLSPSVAASCMSSASYWPLSTPSRLRQPWPKCPSAKAHRPLPAPPPTTYECSSHTAQHPGSGSGNARASSSAQNEAAQQNPTRRPFPLQPAQPLRLDGYANKRPQQCFSGGCSGCQAASQLFDRAYEKRTQFARFTVARRASAIHVKKAVNRSRLGMPSTPSSVATCPNVEFSSAEPQILPAHPKHTTRQNETKCLASYYSILLITWTKPHLDVGGTRCSILSGNGECSRHKLPEHRSRA